MKIATLGPAQLDMLVRWIGHAERKRETFLMAYDETDQSLKVKVGDGAWSPPMPTVER